MLRKISLTLIFVSQLLLRCMRYVNIFGLKGTIAVMLLAVCISGCNFVKFYTKINWLEYVGLGFGFLTYIFDDN